MDRIQIEVIQAAITFVAKAERHQRLTGETVLDFSELKKAVDQYQAEVRTGFEAFRKHPEAEIVIRQLPGHGHDFPRPNGFRIGKEIES